jgi:hypothetical protein
MLDRIIPGFCSVWVSAPADILPVILADRTIPALLPATANPLGTFSTLLQWTMLPRLGTILGSDLREPSCLCHRPAVLSLCLASRTISSIRNGGKRDGSFSSFARHAVKTLSAPFSS